MKKLTSCIASLALAFTASSIAGETPCKRVMWHESKPLKIYAGLYKHVHVILPSELEMQPVNANALWDATGKGKHLFITPTSNEELGKRTTISALTVDGNSFDFITEVDESKFSACVKIINNPTLNANQLRALESRGSSASTQELETKIKAMESNYRRLLSQSEKEKREAVIEAVRKYRYHIYTRYNWKASTSRRSFIGSDLISDVYDDGRFTYLRLTNDNKGLPAIEAVINGEPELIEAKYDEVADLYRVVGIYPMLSLKYKEDEIKISRADTTSRGEF